MTDMVFKWYYKFDKGGACWMNTKLIIIEGLPGFGKSTPAQLTHDILAEMNKEVQLFKEGDVA